MALCVAADYDQEGRRVACGRARTEALVCSTHGCNHTATRPRLPPRLVRGLGEANDTLRLAEEEALHAPFTRSLQGEMCGINKPVERLRCSHGHCENWTQLHPFCPYHLLMAFGLLVDLQRVRPLALDLGVFVFGLTLPPGAPVVSTHEQLCCLRRVPGVTEVSSCISFAEELSPEALLVRYGHYTAPWGIAVRKSENDSMLCAFDGAFRQTPALLANTGHACNAVFEHRLLPAPNVSVVAAQLIENGDALMVNYGPDYTLTTMPVVCDRPALAERLGLREDIMADAPASLYGFGGPDAHLCEAPAPGAANAHNGVTRVMHCHHLATADVCALLCAPGAWALPTTPARSSTPGWVMTALAVMARLHELGALAWVRVVMVRPRFWERFSLALTALETPSIASSTTLAARRVAALMVAGTAECLTAAMPLCEELPHDDIQQSAHRALALLNAASPITGAAVLLALQLQPYRASARGYSSPFHSYTVEEAKTLPLANRGVMWVQLGEVIVHLPAMMFGPTELPVAKSEVLFQQAAPASTCAMMALVRYLDAVVEEMYKVIKQTDDHHASTLLFCRAAASLEQVQSAAWQLRATLHHTFY
jgi:hypothetical protein